ncbi:MAG: hypothetical protein ACOYJB_07155 [Christensenellaceae bacterium]|jgi:hypothetical protein
MKKSIVLLAAACLAFTAIMAGCSGMTEEEAAQLVGRWQSANDEKCFYELGADGTAQLYYGSRLIDDGGSYETSGNGIIITDAKGSEEELAFLDGQLMDKKGEELRYRKDARQVLSEEEADEVKKQLAGQWVRQKETTNDESSYDSYFVFNDDGTVDYFLINLETDDDYLSQKAFDYEIAPYGLVLYGIKQEDVVVLQIDGDRLVNTAAGDLAMFQRK